MTDFKYIPAPDDLRELFKSIFDHGDNAIIAGGAIRDYYEALIKCDYDFGSWNTFVRKYTPKDIDVFFSDEESFTKFVENQDNIENTDYVSDNSTGILFRTDAYFCTPGTVKWWQIPITLALDCVSRNFGTAEDHIEMFDFTVSQIAMFKSDGSKGLEKDSFYLVMHPDFFEDIEKKKLVLSRSEKSIKNNVIERIHRYTCYGFMFDDDNAKYMIEDFLSSYPELKNFTADDFVRAFINDERVLYKWQLAQKKKRSNDPKQTLLYNVSGNYAISLSNFLLSQGNYLNNKHKKNNEGSFDRNESIERYFVGMAEYFLNNVDADMKKIKPENDKILAKLPFDTTMLKRSNPTFTMLQYHQMILDNVKNYSEEELSRILLLAYNTRIARVYDYDTNQKNTKLFYYSYCDPNAGVLSDENIPSSSYINFKDLPLQEQISRILSESSTNEYFNDSIAKIVLKTVAMKDSEEWKAQTLDFWTSAYDSVVNLDEFPTATNLHNAIDNDVFDSSISPSLMLSLMC